MGEPGGRQASGHVATREDVEFERRLFAGALRTAVSGWIASLKARAESGDAGAREILDQMEQVAKGKGEGKKGKGRK